MRVFKSALVGAVALTTVGLMGLGAPAQAAEPEETIVTKTNFTSAAAQVSTQVTTRCPSGAPYVKETQVTPTFKHPDDASDLRYDSISVSADNREAVVEFTNTRTYEEDAHERVDIFVTLTVTCSSVDRGKPKKHAFTMNGMVPPGQNVTVVSPCPPNYPMVLEFSEVHADWVQVMGKRGTGSTAAVVNYYNPDPMVLGFGNVTAICGEWRVAASE
ncbi:hypothetical protein GCM10010517_50660 [Streptosporangium fragile]|uniref:Uncharacterized protein n=1 Tax=Streptosporangium fragile TaxID=46186 RepID=A0ABP6IJ24_9ACTN